MLCNSMMMAVDRPILDVVPNAAGAWSTARKLNSAISGVAMGIFSTTNGTNVDATENIGFAGNEIDMVAYTAFVNQAPSTRSVGLAHLTDQSGNNRTASFPGLIQSAPYMYTPAAGNILLGSKLSQYFLASSQMRLSFSDITLNNEFSIFVVEDRNLTSEFGALIGATAASPTNLNVGFGVWSDGNIYAIDTTGYLQISNTNANARLLEFTKTAGVREVFENASQLSGSNVSQTRNNVLTKIGQLNSGGTTRYTTGRISEVIIYNRALTEDERIFVTNNIRAYYGV